MYLVQDELDTAKYCSLVDDLIYSSASEAVEYVVLAELKKVENDNVSFSHDPCAIN
jgi:hypothetical protein